MNAFTATNINIHEIPLNDDNTSYDITVFTEILTKNFHINTKAIFKIIEMA